jgi:hypothetical protein
VRRNLVQDLPLQTTTHRYLLAVLAGLGHEIIEVPTAWHPRYSGKSKFGSMRLISSAIGFTRACWWFYTAKRPIFPIRPVKEMLMTLSTSFNLEKGVVSDSVKRGIARL